MSSYGNMNIPSFTHGMDREDEEEMNIYANVDPINSFGVRTETENSKRHQTPQHTEIACVKIRSSRAAAVCLVLLCVLLLTAVIVLGVYIHTKSTNYTEEGAQLLTKNTNLTEERGQLLTNITNLTEERDQLLKLLTKNTNLTEERGQLLTNITNLTEERDQLLKLLTKNTNLTEERGQLLTNITNLTEERDQLLKLLTKNTNLTEERGQLLTNITNLTEERDQLLKLLTKNTNLTEERGQLLTNITNLTEERGQLLTNITNLTEERDQLLTKTIQLTKERDVLSLNKCDLIKQRDQLKQEKNEQSKSLCEKVGWTCYESIYYYVSSEVKNWTESRRYCTDRGADLIIINNKAEQDFVKRISGGAAVWIGLTDSDVEGTWKWVDGSRLTSGFWDPREPNGDRRENCVLNYSPGWADYPCDDTHYWICMGILK
ncbi:CD209 antigen-like protein B [Megalobrama amblycephala]|uniref:CD209 antigen-like protein B n=1 Tax=Megalobrama amblycephala TaxID=75352 RepID=UPI002013FB75|nr:CD209 antigen-like protein B [Megalobrama amblycephala]